MGDASTTLNHRKGWKIMTEEGESLDSNALRAVVSMIKEIEYQAINSPAFPFHMSSSSLKKACLLIHPYFPGTCSARENHH